MNCAKFKYSSALESEDKMYNDVRAFLIDQKINPRLINNIMLSVSEAFTNAYLHGNQADPKKTIQISMTANNNKITADITDEGCGEVKNHGGHKKAEIWHENGRGMMLMKAMTSAISFGKNAATGGLRVSMTFDRNKFKTEKKEQTV